MKHFLESSQTKEHSEGKSDSLQLDSNTSKEISLLLEYLLLEYLLGYLLLEHLLLEYLLEHLLLEYLLLEHLLLDCLLLAHLLLECLLLEYLLECLLLEYLLGIQKDNCIFRKNNEVQSTTCLLPISHD